MAEADPIGYKYRNRGEYVRAQIDRSRQKFSYCKVYMKDVIRYRKMIFEDSNDAEVRILCLGVRSGAEVDQFRAVFFGPLFRVSLVERLASRLDDNVSSRKKIFLARFFGAGWGELESERTVREWKRVAAPGSYMIIAYAADVGVTSTDPTGGLNLEVMCKLWGSRPWFFSETANCNGYHEVIFRL